MIGRGALTGIAALLLMGCLAVVVEAQSDSAIYFTGDRVAARSQGGIIYYSYRGAEYTLTDDHRGASDVTPVRVDVYVDPDVPSRARADGLVRWIDLVCVAVWFVAAAALLPVAVARQRRRRRRQRAFDARQS